MSGRSGLVGPGGGAMSGPDLANQPMDLVKTTGRSMESVSLYVLLDPKHLFIRTGGKL